MQNKLRRRLFSLKRCTNCGIDVKTTYPFYPSTGGKLSFCEICTEANKEFNTVYEIELPLVLK